MSQQRLNHLTRMTIEKDILCKIDFSSLIKVVSAIESKKENLLMVGYNLQLLLFASDIYLSSLLT